MEDGLKKIKMNILRPEEKGIRRFLGDLEADIMELLWKEPPSSVHDIHNQICSSRPLAYTTVMTVMGRLAEKGLLDKDKDGKQFIYSPAVTRRELSGSFISSVLSNLGKDRAPALAHFVEGISNEDMGLLDELEEMIRLKRMEIDGDA